MKEFKIIWDKFRFPDEKEEDEDLDMDDVGYEDSEEEMRPQFRIAQILNGGGENPFVQIKSFNFWTAHTNFRLNKALILLIADVDGVETVDVISRYRFHISVAKAFDEQQVKREVYAKLFETLNEPKQQY